MGLYPMEYCYMIRQARLSCNPFEVGDLVLVHGVHLAIVLLYHEEDNVWLVRLMDGTELALWYDDLEPLNQPDKK